MGSSGPTVFDGKRCPGVYYPPQSTDEWGLPDATDTDPAGQETGTANITFVWWYLNKMEKNLYLAFERQASGTSVYAFYIGTDCNTAIGDPAHNGADYALSFRWKNAAGALDVFELYKWVGGAWVLQPLAGTSGLGGSIFCTGNDNLFAEIRFPLLNFFDPCSPGSCHYITMISAASKAGGSWNSADKDVVELNTPVPINTPPTAVAGANQTICLGSPACFNGSGSIDPDNDIVKYEWDFNYNGITFNNMSAGKTVCYTYTTAGLKRVALRVTDSWGCSNTTTGKSTLYVTVLNLHPNLTVKKTATNFGPGENATIGDKIIYDIWVNNTGDSNFKPVNVTDPKLNAISYILGDTNGDKALNTTEKWLYRGTYNVTQSDICAPILNKATVIGKTLCGNFTNVSNQASVPTTYTASMNITKTSNATGPVSPGQFVGYTIKVCNSGKVTLNNIRVVDNRTGSYFIGTLAPNTCNTTIKTYKVTERDICNSSLVNFAYANATDYCGKKIITAINATVHNSVDYNSSLLIEKTSNATGPVHPGQLVRYTIHVCNTGKLTLYNVKIFDNLTGTDGMVAPLIPNYCHDFHKLYRVTEQDICNGSLVNKVYANATDYCGKKIVTLTNATVVNSVDYNSSLNITKTSNATGPVSPGDVVRYNITVCNSGNLTLNQVTVNDNRTGSYLVGTLLKGQCNTSSFNYTVTEADVCSGLLKNKAYATAMDFCDKPIVTAVNASVSLDVDYNPDFDITKTAEHADPAIPGTKINYTIWINNTGYFNLTNVSIVDLLNNTPVSLSGPQFDYGIANVLEVAENWLFEFNTTVPPIPDPWINNSVTANFSDSCGFYIEKTAWANVSTRRCQTADAGNSTITCGGVPVILRGNATYEDSVMWTKMPGYANGTLLWPFSGDPYRSQYTPPPTGEAEAILVFTAAGACTNVSDTTTVYVVEKPMAQIRVLAPPGYP